MKYIVGIKGLELLEEEKIFLKKINAYGVILFSRNCKSLDQIKALTTSIKELLPEVLIFIDQEGGRVQRIKPPINEISYPNMEYFYNLYKKNITDAKLVVKENFYKLMLELKNLGIDVTCAPVCDLRQENGHDVIGNRSFGYEPQVVIDLALSALEGIQTAGGEGVLKHIPGHGRSTLDSHYDLPVVTSSISELEFSDFLIFKALASSCKYAMTAHIIYSSLDDTAPATCSRVVIDYIRNNIGFKGLLMTDDICMKALSGDDKEKILAASNAGCDIILHCNGNIFEAIV